MRGRGTQIRASVLLPLVAVLVLSSCIWSGPRGDSRAHGYLPDGVVDPTEVAGLQVEWSAAIGPAPTTPVIDGDVALVASGSTLRAFDAQGCGATACEPLWQASVSGNFGQPVIDDGIAYVLANNVLRAYDTQVNDDCSPVPVTCAPLWTAIVSGTHVSAGSGLVVVTGGAQGRAFQAGDGATGPCSGTPRTCAPVVVLDDLCPGFELGPPDETCTTGPASIGDGLVAIGNTMELVIDNEFEPDGFNRFGRLSVFTTDGSGCSAATPAAVPVCTATWQPYTGSVPAAPTIHDGLVSVQSHDYVYDGRSGDVFHSGGITTFDPATLSTPLTAKDTVHHTASGELVLRGDTLFETFGRNVRAVAVDGTVRWSATLPAAAVAMSGAGDVLYVTLASGVVQTFDADGVAGCSGPPVTCTSLHTFAGSTRVAISNDRLWVAGGGSLRVMAPTP